MMPERNLGAPEANRRIVENASPQPGAERALGLPWLQFLKHDGVGVLPEHPVGIPLGLEIPLENLARETRVSLIEVDRQKLEAHRRSSLQQPQQVQQGVRILAARDRDENPI